MLKVCQATTVVWREINLKKRPKIKGKKLNLAHICTQTYIVFRNVLTLIWQLMENWRLYSQIRLKQRGSCCFDFKKFAPSQLKAFFSCYLIMMCGMVLGFAISQDHIKPFKDTGKSFNFFVRLLPFARKQATCTIMRS